MDKKTTTDSIEKPRSEMYIGTKHFHGKALEELKERGEKMSEESAIYARNATLANRAMRKKRGENMSNHDEIMQLSLPGFEYDGEEEEREDDSVYSEFTALVKVKGIGKSDIYKIIFLVGTRPGVGDLWSTAQAFLIKESVSPFVLTALRTAFFSYAILHINPIDEDIQNLTSSIRKFIDENHELWTPLGLTTLADKIYTLIKLQKATGSYSPDFIKAAAIYEVLDGTVQEADPKPTETPA